MEVKEITYSGVFFVWFVLIFNSSDNDVDRGVIKRNKTEVIKYSHIRIIKWIV